MPSDKSMEEVLGLLERPREAYRTAVVTSVEELRGTLADGSDEDAAQATRLSADLGPFAAGRVDPQRLLVALEKRTRLDEAATEVVRQALDILTDRMSENGNGGVATVPEGDDLRDVVKDALTEAGRAFGAARAAELARLGTYDPAEHNALFSGHPFRRWTRAERRVAPPLVVQVQGGDLRPAGLADFLEGSLKIVLVVRGAAPPASLSRLVSPGVFVMQTRDASTIGVAGDFAGPAVVALFDDDATDVVPFVHDPRAGGTPGERIHLDGELDELKATLAEAHWKESGWKEDLAHLLDLATPTALPVAEEGEAPAVEPATSTDRLAAWLLAQTSLDG